MMSIPTIVTIFVLTGAVELALAAGAMAYTSKPYSTKHLDRLQVSPVVSPTHINLFEQGSSKQELEDYAGAVSDYTEFLKTHPYHLEAYTSRGFARAMLNDLKGAITDFDRALQISPAHADSYNARGNVNAMAGNLVASLRDFNRAIRLNHNFADAYYNRAISRHGLGDRRGAKLDLSKAARLFRQQSDLGGYQQAREWMNKLR